MHFYRFVQGAQIWTSKGFAQCNKVIPESFPLGEAVVWEIRSRVWGWEQLLSSFCTWKLNFLRQFSLSRQSIFFWFVITFLYLQANTFEIPEENLCLSFLSNNNTGEDGTVVFRGEKYYIPSRSVSILVGCKNVVYNTKRVCLLHVLHHMD